MPRAEAAAIITTRPGRIRYDRYEIVGEASGTCPMCGAPIEPHVPHACAKPDLDHPPHAVRARCEPFESATFPFLVHRGMTCRFEGRVYRCASWVDSAFVDSREVFDALVEVGILEEVPCG